jgi:predicted permease
MEPSLTREIASHLALLEEEYRRRGMSPQEAYRAGRVAFGGVELTKELHRSERSFGWLDDLQRDVRYAVRSLRRNSGFATAAIITLALGIGAMTAIYAVVNGVLLKPLPYPAPRGLVALSHIAPGVDIGGTVFTSPAQLFTYRDENRSFEEIGLWSSELASVTGLAQPEEVRRLTVTYGTLQALRVQPVLGRSFSPRDDVARAPATVLLAYDFWLTRFGGDPSALGRSIVIDAEPRQIIGVMPKGFRFLDVTAQVILPMRLDRAAQRLGAFNHSGLARLKSGVTVAQANADVARMNAIWLKSWPEPTPGYRTMMENARLTPTIRPLKDEVVEDIARVLWVLMGTIGVVLVIACANVANLFLVRAGTRQQEWTVRMALGAGWRRIARELLTESVVLSITGGTLGLAFAYGTLSVLVASGPSTLPRLSEITIDLSVVAFTLLISVLSGISFGILPVVRYARRQTGGTLRAGGRTVSESRERHLSRNILMVTEVALALVLVVGAGLMIRTLWAMRSVHPGFAEPEQVQLMRINIPSARVGNGEQVLRLQQEIRDRLAAIPGVTAVAFASSAPMEEFGPGGDILLARDRSYSQEHLPPVRRVEFVSPGFFATLGIRLIAGRDLTWADLYSYNRVVLISENVAREMWRDPTAALGQQVRESLDSPWREVVGVVGNVYDDGVHEEPSETVYWPVLMQDFWRNRTSIRRSVTFVVRSPRAGTEGFTNEIRSAVWAVIDDVPVARLRTLQEVYDQSMARTSFILVMLTIAGTMALVLGIVGMYAVVSHAAAQRTREIGIRSALGAQQSDLKRLFISSSLQLAALGVLIGVVGALALTRLIASLLFRVSSHDMPTFVIAACLILVAAFLASYLPARRAARVDPLVALRYE